jgi:hypothetical protein
MKIAYDRRTDSLDASRRVTEARKVESETT